MIIKTRKLPATTTEGERMRATADNGAVLTLPYPYGAADPHQLVADALVMAYNDEFRAARESGNVFRVTEKTAEGDAPPFERNSDGSWSFTGEESE